MPVNTPDHSAARPLTAQELTALDTSAWFENSNGSVDLGLSPVLSYESQTAHSLNSMPGPHSAVMPPNLDLSFLSEPCWNVTYPDVSAMPQLMPVVGFVSPPLDLAHQSHVELIPCAAAPRPALAPVHQPVYCPQNHHSGRTMSSGPAAAPHRTLLPRTEDHGAVSSQPLYQHTPILRPYMPTRSAPSTEAVVSRSSLQPSEKLVAQPLPSPGLVPVSSVPPVARFTSGHAMATGQGPARSGFSHGSNVPSAPAVDDIGAFFHFDDTDHATTPGTTRSAQCQSMCGKPTDRLYSHVPVFGKAAGVSTLANAQQELDTVANESDEGRHRNHPLYSEGPKADGLYHCPFLGDPACQHKPTKLKCNYEYAFPSMTTAPRPNTDLAFGPYSKFIDSHLKPFRCKVESCSKQEFSSTACLLRHEREAHGMHGHGERPHLCFYPGCERGMLGNGFPRRYNLFDHMRRVHDHKDDASDRSNSPVMGESKKVNGRKRKASNPQMSEPVSQRPRIIAVPRQQPLAMHHPTVHVLPAHYQPLAEPHPHQELYQQRLIYDQWENQKAVLHRQVEFLQSPNDEASLNRLTQNVAEFRRLSEEARRG